MVFDLKDLMSWQLFHHYNLYLPSFHLQLSRYHQVQRIQNPTHDNKNLSGEDYVTEKGIRKSYYKTFELCARGAILKTKKYWELEERIPIPLCMQRGSLKQAVELMTFNSQYDFLMTKRTYNVDNHIRTHVNGEYGLKPGEKVRDIYTGQLWF